MVFSGYMNKKSWKHELARDFLALGSWIFYILVLARSAIRPYRPFVDHLVIAGVLLVLAVFIFKNHEGYVSRTLVLVWFTIIFYNDLGFSVFAVLAFLGVIASSKYTGSDWKKIVFGVVVGLVAVVVGYYGSFLI